MIERVVETLSSLGILKVNIYAHPQEHYKKFLTYLLSKLLEHAPLFMSTETELRVEIATPTTVEVTVPSYGISFYVNNAEPTIYLHDKISDTALRYLATCVVATLVDPVTRGHLSTSIVLETVSATPISLFRKGTIFTGRCFVDTGIYVTDKDQIQQLEVIWTVANMFFQALQYSNLVKKIVRLGSFFPFNNEVNSGFFIARDAYIDRLQRDERLRRFVLQKVREYKSERTIIEARSSTIGYILHFTFVKRGKSRHVIYNLPLMKLEADIEFKIPKITEISLIVEDFLEYVGDRRYENLISLFVTYLTCEYYT